MRLPRRWLSADPPPPGRAGRLRRLGRPRTPEYPTGLEHTRPTRIAAPEPKPPNLAAHTPRTSPPLPPRTNPSPPPRTSPPPPPRTSPPPPPRTSPPPQAKPPPPQT